MCYFVTLFSRSYLGEILLQQQWLLVVFRMTKGLGANESTSGTGEKKMKVECFALTSQNLVFSQDPQTAVKHSHPAVLLVLSSSFSYLWLSGLSVCPVFSNECAKVRFERCNATPALHDYKTTAR